MSNNTNTFGLFASIGVLGYLLTLCIACAHGEEAFKPQRHGTTNSEWTVVGAQLMDVVVVHKERIAFSMDNILWGPGWNKGSAFLDRRDSLAEVVDGKRLYEAGQIRLYDNKGDYPHEPLPGSYDLRYEMSQIAPEAVRIRYEVKTDKDVRMGSPGRQDEDTFTIGPKVAAAAHFSGGEATFTLAHGGTENRSLPTRGGFSGVTAMTLTTADGNAFRFSFEPALFVHADAGEIRMFCGNNVEVPANGTMTQEILLTLPAALAFEPANRWVDTSGWFPYEGRQDFRPGSAIGMEEWLAGPAGKRGYVQIDEGKGRFVFEDGTPVKFWGTNISWADMARPEDEVVRYADKFAKHGVNMVRMHKFVHEHTGLDGWPYDASTVWDGIMDPDDPMEFHEGAMRRFDHMHAALKERGIYAGWSPFAFLGFRERYRDRLIDYDELKATGGGGWLRGGQSMVYGTSTFARDVQDLYTELIVKLLNHVNPYTGLRYADDPALGFVEFRNEICGFIGNARAGRSPVYKRLISEEFCRWLRERYPSEEALRAAWTVLGLQEGESLDEGTIFPFPDWGRINQTPHSRRLLDSYRFLFEYQDGYYQRFVRAAREAGYRGPLVGSGWWTADWLGYLYNMENDRRVGIIDRHNYSGRGAILLGRPGWGILGSGSQQVGWTSFSDVVRDRPYALTEWAGAHVYAAEVSPIVGLIGMGVQGWDTSTQYGSNWWGIATNARTGIHNTTEAFHHIGQWPFISRILHSGALRQGETVVRRRVSMGDLYPLDDASADDFVLMGGESWQQIEDSVPREALAIGRVELEFVDRPVEDKLLMADLDRYWDRERRIIRASNGQIVWDYSGRGFFTVDTEAGQAVIGFGGGRQHVLSDVTVSYDVPFANVYVVPRHPGETVAEARSLVILVLGRTADEGDVLEEGAMTPFRTVEPPHTDGGRAEAIRHWIENPVLIFEPVRATLTLSHEHGISNPFHQTGQWPSFRVYALDHDGRLPAEPVQVPVMRTADGQQFVLDGSRYQTMYYLVTFENP